MWFDQWKTQIADINCKIKNDTLQGTGLIYAKTFQLYNSFNFVGIKQYIAPSDGKDFADLLFYKVCDSNIELVVEYQKKLFTRRAEPDNGAFMFASDISSYITGDKDPISAMAIMSKLIGFVAATNMVIANSFGDHKTVTEIKSKIMKL